MITWGGVSLDAVDTEDTKIIMRKAPTISRPSRKYEKYSVPGRNGDLYIPQKAYNNYTQTYEVFLYTNEEGAKLNAFATNVANILYAPTGYSKLEDNNEPEYYRMAYYTGPFDVQNSLLQFGKATIAFDCRPERFLISGDEEISVTSGDLTDGWYEFTNTTGQAARPLIEINLGNYPKLKIQVENDDDEINGWIYDVQDGVSQLTVDSEKRSWTSDVPYAGRYVYGDGMPVLSGQNARIKIVGCNESEEETGDYPDFTIIPRWWVL